MKKKKAIVIGSGFGGLAIALRLQAQGFEVSIFEKRDKAGGRAYVFEEDGYVWDCGPTIITAPYLIDELFALFDKKTADYMELTAINPYYRIYFHDGSYYDYNGDLEKQALEVAKINPNDLEGFHAFVKDSNKILEKGYLELGDYPFMSFWDMVKILPNLIGLDAFKNMYQFAAKYFEDERLRRVFSFHSLLIGGNPYSVTSIYALIPALERKWGVHFAMGGTGQIVKGLTRLFQENGGKLYLNAEVKKILISDRKFEGIQLKDDLCYFGDLLVSNADFADVHLRLIDEEYRRKYTNKKIESLHYSMSSIILFFGFKRSEDLNILHHNIILSEAYKELLDSIFKHKALYSEFSQYLHIPSITDPTMAPEGYHVAYTLIPVPNLSAEIDWNAIKEEFAEKIVQFLDDKGFIPNLRNNLSKMKIFTPLDFKSELNSYLGTGWGVEPRLSQSASFRPHNRSEEVDHFYLVGASTQPGAGVPGVLMTAKVTEKLIKEDFNLA